jgi:hypothetical protein
LRFGHHRIRIVDNDDAPLAFERPVSRTVDGIAHLFDPD